MSYCCVVLVFGSGFRGNPANPGWGLGWVCLGTGFGLRPSIPGWGLWRGRLGLGFGLHSSIPGLGFGACVVVCALRLYPAFSGSAVRCGCVCLGSGFGCAPPLLAGVLGCVCVCVRALFVPRHSWLGCAVWVCVLGLGFWLRPATPGWAVGLCVCLCARSACTPPLLAGVCGVLVCAWAPFLAAPRHSWLECWGVCVCVCVRAPLLPRHSWLRCAVWLCVLGLGFRLRPATPGWGVGVGVCLCVRSVSAPPLLAGVLGCVCLCARSFCTPPLLAAVCGVGVCAWARVWLRPATPGWGAGVCVCLCARSFCTPPLLAGVCGVVVCAWARVSAAPRHSWLGCGEACVFVCALRFCPATPRWGVLCGCVPTRPTGGGIFFERISVFERRFESSNEDSNLKIVIALIAIQSNPIESKLLGRIAAKAQRHQRARQIDRRLTQICARKTQICARKMQICARKKDVWFFQLIGSIF